MKEGLTEVISLVDRSGSMQSILDDAIGGLILFWLPSNASQVKQS